MPSFTKKEYGILAASFLTTTIFSFIVALLLLPKVISTDQQIETVTSLETDSITHVSTDNDTVDIVLVGHGGAGHPGGGLADAILLLSLKPSESKAKIISIPRDLWVDNNKINDKFAQSPEELKDALGIVTGIYPDHYMSVDFVSFKRAIATVGGITVQVPETFDDYFYPIEGEELNICGFSPEKMQEVHEKYSGFELEKQFTCRYEHLHFEKGPVNMQGGDALAFVRSRHSGQHGGDFSRSERQQALLLGLRDRLLEIEVWDDIPAFYEEMKGFVSTSLDLDAIVNISRLIINPDSYEIDHIYLNTENVLTEGKSSAGAYILYPKAGISNWSEIQSHISSN